jgi:hypothetical protein
MTLAAGPSTVRRTTSYVYILMHHIRTNTNLELKRELWLPVLALLHEGCLVSHTTLQSQPFPGIVLFLDSKAPHTGLTR